MEQRVGIQNNYASIPQRVNDSHPSSVVGPMSSAFIILLETIDTRRHQHLHQRQPKILSCTTTLLTHSRHPRTKTTKSVCKPYTQSVQPLSLNHAADRTEIGHLLHPALSSKTRSVRPPFPSTTPVAAVTSAVFSGRDNRPSSTSSPPTRQHPTPR